VSDPRDLGRVLTPAYDEDRTAATWQRIAEARAGRRRTRRAPAWTWGLGLAAIAATATIAVVMLVGRGDAVGRPLASVDPGISLGEGARVDALADVRAVAMDDGSRVELASNTQLQVLANAGDRFVTLLERGAAKFDVKEHGPRRWEIETALATVEVVGTAFTVEHSETRLVVEVQRGVVMVRGERVPGRVVRLVAGERLEVTAEPATVTAAADPVPHSGSRFPIPYSPGPEPETETNRDYGTGTGTENAPAPEPVATVKVTPKRARMDEALARADALRAAGDAAGAADLLDAALAVDDRSPAAGLAAFTLGRLALDRLGQPERAARAFARVIALGSPHGLLEDAYARRAEALIRSGDRAAAEAALSEYERAFPDARRAPALRAQLQGK
jgi:transmembrane sensor